MIHAVPRPNRALLVAASILAAATACRPAPADGPAGSGTRTAPPGPVKPAALGEARIDNPAVVVRLTRVERFSAEAVAVSFTIANPNPASAVSPGAVFATSGEDEGSMADTFLIDEANQRKYFVLRDDTGRAVCGEPIGSIPPNGERTAWCRFPGPPAGVGRISVAVPRLPIFRDVPIAEPPAGRPAPAEWGRPPG